MAARTPLRQKQTTSFSIVEASRVLPGAAKLASPRLHNALSDKKRKAPTESYACANTEHKGGKHSSPALKRARRDSAPIAPVLERGKKSKARKEKDETLREGVAANKEEWQRKYRTAFRRFVFYFDGIDGTKRDELTTILTGLGSTVDNFFSTNGVTHVITTRVVATGKPDAVVIDVDADKENIMHASFAPSAIRTNKPSPVKGGAAVDHQDVLLLAANHNIKIWDLKKVYRIVEGLLDPNSPIKASATKPLSLPKLLRDEQLSGMTRERDPDALRHDYYYFPAKTAFVLVEDSTNLHRPVIIKEYARRRHYEEPEWPVLYGGQEGRSAFHRPPGGMLPLPPAVALPPNAQRPIALTINGPHCLRRAVSLSQLHKRHLAETATHKALEAPVDIQTSQHHHEASGFLAASGNSVALTSNIASVTSGAPLGTGVMGAADKRLAILDRRQVVSQSRFDSSGLLTHFGVRAPGPLKRSLSVDAGLGTNSLSREQPAKPGYCENCRLRFEDIRDHVRSRRHRKFALNDANWTELDSLLVRIQRPLRSEVLHCLKGDPQLHQDLRAVLRLPKAPLDFDTTQDDLLSSPSNSEKSAESSAEEDAEACAHNGTMNAVTKNT